jgi:hypothetical protein
MIRLTMADYHELLNAYKALQLTSQYAVSLRYTLYCRSTELKR